MRNFHISKRGCQPCGQIATLFLLLEGFPLIKHEYAKEEQVVGLDIGPSSIAIVGDKYANLQAFCPEVKNHKKDIVRLQREMSRSLRATNKDNFEDYIFKNNRTGKVKKGAKVWNHSNNYKSMLTRLQEMQRKMVATRKSSHGNLVNTILKHGITIKTEKLHYKSFQKLYGKSVGLRAPD